MRVESLIGFIFILTLVACDCQYRVSGVVLDKFTKEPVSNVAIGRTDTANLDNPFNRKSFTGENGKYDIYGVAGACDEITMYYTKEKYKTKRISFPSNSLYDTIFLEPIENKVIEIFDYKKDFKFEGLHVLHNDFDSSEKSYLACNEWTPTKLEIKKIIKESRPINGPEWHHLFGHLPCRIDGKLIQNNNEYEFSINAGAWFTISSADTTLRFGSFKEENNKYFLSSAWTEAESE